MTRYEITASHPDGRAFLIGYTPRLSRPGLRNAMRRHGQAMIDRLGIGDDDTLTWYAKPRPHCLIGQWDIGFTGRTQNESQQAGELPFIAERKVT